MLFRSVKQGVPFREAHEIIGRLVLLAIEKNVALDNLTLDELKMASDIFDETVFAAISAEACVNARALPGGPAESAVLDAINESERWLHYVR